jgi:hypothetical protein
MITMRTRTVPRPRRYLAKHWLALLAPLLRYSYSRDAYLLRAIGERTGPVFREDRRTRRHLGPPGPERRRTRAA